MLSRRSYELLSLFLTPLLPIYAFNNIEIELLIKIQCSSQEPTQELLCSCSRRNKPNVPNVRFQMLFQETSAFCYLAARRVDPKLAL